MEGAPAADESWWSRGWLPAVVLVLVTLVYVPSLGGDWVWDDHAQLAANPGLRAPWTLWTTDIRFGAASQATDVYRPLVMSSYLLGQRLAPGPLSARLGNLALHLGAVALVARLAQDLGARRRAAWLAAAVFGVHPGTTEAVAWVTGRHDVLPAMLLLSALVLLPRRPLLAGALCACTPLAKEPYLLAPVALALWALGRRQSAWPAVAVAATGPVVALALRTMAGVALPIGAAGSDPVGALGALLVRGVTLVLMPTAPDAAPLYQSRLGFGVLAVALLGAGGGAVLRGHRTAALALAPAILLLPCAPASARIGLIGDRYYYFVFATLAVGAACAIGRTRWTPWLWLAPALLAPLSAQRVTQWRSDLALWSASHARDPANPHAAFHLAYALHTQSGDCAAAVPLYREALVIEARARTNIMACLVQLGRNEEAVALAPELAAQDPDDPKVPAAAARALVGAGRLEEARSWAARATKAGGRAEDLVLLGNIAGAQGDLDAAEGAFRAALVAAPGHPGAEAGLRAVAARRAAASPPPGVPTQDP